MKKILSIILVGLLSASSVSCREEKKQPQQTEAQKNEIWMRETMRSHPRPGLYEREAFQRHVNSPVYGEGMDAQEAKEYREAKEKAGVEHLW